MFKVQRADLVTPPARYPVRAGNSVQALGLRLVIKVHLGACSGDARLLPRAGVIQMNAGIVNSLFNQLYFRDSLSTWCAMRRRAPCGRVSVSCPVVAGRLNGQAYKVIFFTFFAFKPDEQVD